MEDIEILRRILDIDLLSRALDEKTRKLAEDNDITIKKELAAMETQIIEAARQEGRASMQRLIEEAEQEAEKIRRAYEVRLGELDEKFQKRKDGMEKELFFEIFLKGDV
ncbi:hypothetical protein EAL2_c03490 [Peptoclostridium acidaminophilum DSM 3953]|uniref:Uncharacterized protein n=1 Tax=Peptoclostridium acidaminophilum DSM 3953 TaxID=1286171 RepID=W8THL9_PEPAC|nr:hypothetical protein [Peptoclostridium acidaminophilum]AHM55652.1 hypothetical protein EAL2_c03490 [Peptoclostridium acidaminophilum DSM 3953]